MKLNGFALKLIALVLMFGEHFGLYLGELLPAHVPLYLTYAGRIVAPIFFFLSVESYFKTSNRRRYIIRLFAWALAMQVGNLIISEIVKNAYHAEGSLGQNIFLSIAIGISMIAAFEWGRKQSGIKKWGGFVFAGILAFFSLLTESSYNGLAMFIVFYFFYNKKPALYFAYAGLCLLFFLWGLNNIEYFWEFEYQWMMIAALPFIILYNGERGPHSLKYLFYAFYPLHIWALYIIRYSILAFYYPIQ
ncbi:MAG TPA: TraX family protein [Anaerolineaceae bacterium]|nr:TraX family protein [Anaerolineaceae bacterium]HOS54163.1 TraX family protein [Anaerolineaceae bacterium]HPD62115.1 TraX family protein [Anaerolineaceae bacterium]HQF68203.1 TraX family protein [Anaerolineaceae bacterium]HRS73313.1 TraX family protein [Anaerolineaceae bacterium]